ncbi:general stress protein, partial [Microbacterium ulmi]
MMGGRLPQGFDEVGQTVASYPTYEAAQKAVSSLIAADVPARDIAIVGTGLRSIERITGKLGYATAARSGAINGLLLGLLFSAIFVLGTPSPPIQLFVGVLFVGIAIGMLMSIISFAIVRRRRDFASVMQVVAEHYEVSVASASVNRARQVLGAQTVVARPAPAPTVDASEPPRYGERVFPAPAGGAAPASGDRPPVGAAAGAEP